MKIDWVKKLTSRKFWLAIVGFISPLMIVLGAEESVATQITGIIMSGAAVIAYIIGEGLTDSAALNSEGEKNDNKQIDK